MLEGTMMREIRAWLIWAFVLLSSGPAFAQAAPECRSIDAERELATTHGGKVNALEGDAVKAAEKLFNSIPPETDYVANTAILVDMPDGWGVLAIGPAGAICARARFDATGWKGVREKLLGFLT